MTSFLFSHTDIAALVQPAARQVAVELVAETGSTNADLLARIERLPGPVLLAAERQTAGRGRAGRTWHSDPASSLTFSLAWPFQRPLAALTGLPLAVGVALAETLANAGASVQLKWPNDLLTGSGKLGGILVETAPAVHGTVIRTWAVIGVGLNLALPADLAGKIDGSAAALPFAVAQDRNALLAALLNSLSVALEQFEHAGLGPFVPRWNALHAHAGQPVQIIDHGRVLHEGIASGVDAMGRLLLDTGNGQVAVMAGDVSLRTQGGHHAVAG